jgi:hypothetical protein
MECVTETLNLQGAELREGLKIRRYEILWHEVVQSAVTRDSILWCIFSFHGRFLSAIIVAIQTVSLMLLHENVHFTIIVVTSANAE